MTAPLLEIPISVDLPDPPGLIGARDLDPANLLLPLIGHRATCGFPSPAEDHMAEGLDLNQRCIRNPVATYFMEVDTGASMTDFGIFPGDTIIVDRSINARHGYIVVALWDGGYTVKQLHARGRQLELRGNAELAPMIVAPDTELLVWGVVTWSFRPHFRP